MPAFEQWLKQNACLTARQAGDYIFEQFEIDYIDSAVTQLLHRLGYVYKKVKPVRGKADEEDQQAFIQQLEQLPKEPDTAFFLPMPRTLPTTRSRITLGLSKEKSGR